jgi:putative transport protein
MHFMFDTIRHYPEIALFITLGIGFWVGSLKLGSFSLGAVASTLLAGLVVGQLHIAIAPVVGSTFFTMFLFAVGYSVGPQFFRAMKKDGLPQVAFTLIVCGSGVICAYLLGKWLGFGPGLTAGLLAGGYTNSGTLGVATSHLKQLGLGADRTAALASLTAIAYAVTYPFGAAGAAWFLSSFAPRLLHIDLAASCADYERTAGLRSAEPGIGSAYHPVAARAYRVESPGMAGRKASDVAAILETPYAFVMRVRNNGKISDVDPETALQPGLAVVVAGPLQALVTAQTAIGPEVNDPDLLSFPTEQLDVVVTKKDAANRTIQELQDAELARFGRCVFVSKLQRNGVDINPHPNLALRQHDVLTLLGARKDIEKAASFVGYADRATASSDIAYMSAGVAVGSILGAVTIHVGGIPLSFSPSVGALVAGLVCGYLRSVYRSFGRIPDPALWVFNNVGLSGFIAVVGLNAAAGLIAGLKAYGIRLFSHSIDDSSNGLFIDAVNEPATAQDIFNRKRDRGRSGFDICHNFVANATYDLPLGHHRVLEGWQISGIGHFHSNVPFTPVLAFDNADVQSLLIGQRPDLIGNPYVGSCPNGSRVGSATCWFNPSAFGVPPSGQFGTAGRNILRGPAYAEFDLALRKSFTLGEGKKIIFGAEAFNLLNHPNFAVPSNTQSPLTLGGNGDAVFKNAAGHFADNAGRIFSTAGDARQVQLAARFVF